jgi:hypothetical protein
MSVKRRESVQGTHDLGSIILVAIGLHVPYDLVAKELRHIHGFEDKLCYILKHTFKNHTRRRQRHAGVIKPKDPDDLRNEKEC